MKNYLPNVFPPSWRRRFSTSAIFAFASLPSRIISCPQEHRIVFPWYASPSLTLISFLHFGHVAVMVAFSNMSSLLQRLLSCGYFSISLGEGSFQWQGGCCMREPKLLTNRCPQCGGKLQTKQGHFFTYTVCPHCETGLDQLVLDRHGSGKITKGNINAR